MASVFRECTWFNEARFGLFIHWGAYAQYGRGEQVLFREHLDQREYAEMACQWNPKDYDPAEWAAVAKRAGMKYAVLTTRHHDGFCLWDSKQTDYTTVAQAAGRDMVRDYAEAFRTAGLKVGLYYSLADWRIPAYWRGPEKDPEGWAVFRDYVHAQVRELMSDYGAVDVLWFDGSWPHYAEDWRSHELVNMIRDLQPGILINNRLGRQRSENLENPAGPSPMLGDFGTPEHRIEEDPNRPWESCQVPTWRLWGYCEGERWRPADVILDTLVECAGRGGNLLLNVGPKPDGTLPPEFAERMEAIGQWMDVHGEAIYGTEPGEVCEFVTYGRQTRKENRLYLVIRFWQGASALRLAGLATRVKRAGLLTTGQELRVTQGKDEVTINGLPVESPTPLFPVIKLECEGPPQAAAWAKDRLWQGDASRMASWAEARGEGVRADGRKAGTAFVQRG